MSPVVLPEWVEAAPSASMAVSAGAGSGKTTSLVGRVAALLALPDVEPSQLVVITFTEKAARDVSHRLRRTLGHHVPLDEAFIGTIHGFCQSILRRYPIEAGLPPKFTTADQLTSRAVADERAEQAVQQLYNLATKKPAIEEALMVIASFGAMWALPELVRSIDNDWLHCADGGAAVPMPAGVAVTTVLRMLDQAATDERYVAANKGVRARVDAAVADARAAVEFLDTIHTLAIAAKSLAERQGGTSPAWQPFSQAMRFACFEPTLRQVMSALAPIVVQSAHKRIGRGELSFDDLLVLTRRLLLTNPAVRRGVGERHRYLFVDEFQDTDQVQFDIIQLLTGSGAGARQASLFAVGDPKQSIYGFRNADVSLFAGLLADGTGQQLTVNRRTRADVCRWINEVLGHRFASGDDGEVEHQVPYVALEPLRAANDPSAGPAVTVLGVPDGHKVDYDTAEDTARAEAADVAAIVQRIVAADQPWLVGEQSRPAQHMDITVLVRSRTRLGVLEHTLRTAGVPYRVEGGTLIYGSREVYELLRVLRAVDDPTNQLKVVTALRTSIFAISDVQLMEHRLGPADGDPLRYPRDFKVFTHEPGIVGEALADHRSAGSSQARAHPGRAARRAVRRLARRCRGAVRGPAGGTRDVAASALRHRRSQGMERCHRRNLGRVPGLGRPAHRRRRPCRAEHRRG